MSWQTYVDEHLMCDIDGHRLTAAAIIGHDGSVWAQSSTFPQVPCSVSLCRIFFLMFFPDLFCFWLMAFVYILIGSDHLIMIHYFRCVKFGFFFLIPNDTFYFSQLRDCFVLIRCCATWFISAIEDNWGSGFCNLTSLDWFIVYFFWYIAMFDDLGSKLSLLLFYQRILSSFNAVDLVIFVAHCHVCWLVRLCRMATISIQPKIGSWESDFFSNWFVIKSYI